MSAPRPKSAPRRLHVCIMYDCLFPYTIGGAERWYRALAERLASEGHRVTYLTLKQWDDHVVPQVEGVEVIAVGPRLALYDAERRRIWPPLLFGLAIFWHLLRHGRQYSHVHGASFPFFSTLAAGFLKPFIGYAFAVDWFEVWSRQYWNSYLGSVGGRIGWLVQRLCAALPQQAFAFSTLHAERLTALGRESIVLTGLYQGDVSPPLPPAHPPTFVYAGRMIPEKRVPLLVEAFAIASAKRPDLRMLLFGKGPDRDLVEQRIKGLGLSGSAILSGFVEQPDLDAAMASAVAIVQPSMREGYGLVVVEANARGVPAIVVEGEDNAAVELVTPGANGEVAEATAAGLAKSMLAVVESQLAYRQATREWFAENQHRLSIDESLATLLKRMSPSTHDRY